VIAEVGLLASLNYGFFPLLFAMPFIATLAAVLMIYQKAFASLEENFIHANTTAEAAQKASNSKSEFLASMSHELRTPLNSILGFTDIILKGMWPPDWTSEQIATHTIRNLNHIKVSGARLLLLINDILDLAKIEAGVVEIRPSNISLRQAVEEVVVAGGGIIHKLQKSIYLKSYYAENLPAYVSVDCKRLQQIITNLISNAVKFTDVGGITVSVELVDAQHYVIYVSDTGFGMTEEAKNYIFERWRQVSTGIREEEGTGLGLTITKQLVEMMGGTIDFDAGLGKGSTFHIVLPINQADSEMIQT